MSLTVNPNGSSALGQQSIGGSSSGIIPQPSSSQHGNGSVSNAVVINPLQNHAPLLPQPIQHGGGFAVESLSIEKPESAAEITSSIKEKIVSNEQETKDTALGLRAEREDSRLKYDAYTQLIGLKSQADKLPQKQDLHQQLTLQLEDANRNADKLIETIDKSSFYIKTCKQELANAASEWEQQHPLPKENQTKESIQNREREKANFLSTFEQKLASAQSEKEKLSLQLKDVTSRIQDLTSEVSNTQKEVVELTKYKDAFTALNTGNASLANALGFDKIKSFQEQDAAFRFDTQDPQQALNDSESERTDAEQIYDAAKRKYWQANLLLEKTQDLRTAITEFKNKVDIQAPKQEIEDAFRKVESEFGKAAKNQKLNDLDKNALLSTQKAMQASYAQQKFRETAEDFGSRGVGKSFSAGISVKGSVVPGVSVGGGVDIETSTGKNGSSGVFTADKSLKVKASAGGDVGIANVNGDVSLKGGQQTKYPDLPNFSRSQSTHYSARAALDGPIYGIYTSYKARHQRQETLEMLPLMRQASNDLHKAGLIDDDMHIERQEPLVGKRSGQSRMVEVSAGVSASVTAIKVKGAYTYSSTWERPILNKFDQLTSADEHSTDTLFPDEPDIDKLFKVHGDNQNSGQQIKTELENLIANANVLQGQERAEALMKSAIKDINDFALLPENERAELRQELGVKTNEEYNLAKKRLFEASRVAFEKQGGDVENNTRKEGLNAFKYPQVVSSAQAYRDALEVKGDASRTGEHEISLEITTANIVEKFGSRGADLIPKAKATINFTNQTIKIEGNFTPKATLTAIRGALSEYTPNPSSSSGMTKQALPKSLDGFEWGDIGDKFNAGIEGKFKGTLELEYGKGNTLSILKAKVSGDIQVADLGLGGTVDKDSGTKVTGTLSTLVPAKTLVPSNGVLDKALDKMADLSSQSATYMGKSTLTPAYDIANEIVTDLHQQTEDEQAVKFREALAKHPKTTEAWLSAISEPDSKVNNWLEWLSGKHDGALDNDIHNFKQSAKHYNDNVSGLNREAALNLMFTVFAKSVALDK